MLAQRLILQGSPDAHWRGFQSRAMTWFSNIANLQVCTWYVCPYFISLDLLSIGDWTEARRYVIYCWSARNLLLQNLRSCDKIVCRYQPINTAAFAFHFRYLLLGVDIYCKSVAFSAYCDNVRLLPAKVRFILLEAMNLLTNFVSLYHLLFKSTKASFIFLEFCHLIFILTILFIWCQSSRNWSN